MAISGKCYLSLHEHNKSANRGACLQNCRRAYEVKDRDLGYELEIDNEYIMSPKDLCTIEFIDKIVASGATVLKIEGRGRSADYVKTTVETYKKAIESYFTRDYSLEKAAQWKNDLGEVLNRGFWDGYYLGRRLGEWTEKYGSSATKRKIQIGKVNNYFSKIKVASVKLQSYDLQVGDEILFIGETTGAEKTIVKEIRLDDKSIEKAEKGHEISIPLDFKVRRSDKLFKLVDANEILEQK
jgi:putative protease